MFPQMALIVMFGICNAAGNKRADESLCEKLSLPEENGWCIFQKHQTKPRGDQSMNKTWIEYKDGFGNDSGGVFWGGLEKIRTLTNSGEGKLRIEWSEAHLYVWNGYTELKGGYIEYDGFKLMPESDRYRFQLSGKNIGTVPDIFFTKCGSIDFTAGQPIGHQFATYDNDSVCQSLGDQRYQCEPAKSGERGEAARLGCGWWMGGNPWTMPNGYFNDLSFCKIESLRRGVPPHFFPSLVKMMAK